MPTLQEIIDCPALKLTESESNYKTQFMDKLITSTDKTMPYFNCWSAREAIDACEELKIELKARCIHDYRRSASLYVVLWCNQPILIVARAGREEDDHQKHYVLDRLKTKEMFNTIKALVEKAEDSGFEESPLAEEITMPMCENRRTVLGEYWINPNRR